MTTATILIIGDELLHGEIKDQNGPWLIDQLNKNGVTVERLHLLPDRKEVLANYLSRAKKHDYVLTTGGIGPTHDDRTRQAVAETLDRNMTPNDRLLSLLRQRHGDQLNDSQKNLATLPRGSRVVHQEGSVGMAFVTENIYVFPGIPDLLKSLFKRLEPEFNGERKYSRSLTIRALESDIANTLSQFQNRYPDLQFGSYPHDDGTLTLKIRGFKENLVKNIHTKLEDQINHPKVES